MKEIKMPSLSPTMESGKIVKWIKKEGEDIKIGDIIAEIETDKASMEYESEEEGKLGKIIMKEGEEVKVGKVIGIILEEGEEHIEEYKAEEEKTENKESGNEKINNNDNSYIDKLNNKIFISPLAKVIARQNNIELSNIKATGPNNRIVKTDILSYLNNKAIKDNVSQKDYNNNDFQNTFIDVPNSSMRKIIAKRLLESKTSIPHYYLNVECIVDELIKTRTNINLHSKDKYKISINDFIIKAVGLAMKDVPEANSYWQNDTSRQFTRQDVAVAVAIPNGLITPIVKDVANKGLLTISNEMKTLAKRAREGSLVPEEYQGGGFAISNLGMYGIDSFAAIINPPQSGILAVGTIQQKAIVVDNNIVIGNILNLVLSADHRIMDGAVGATFLVKIKNYLEYPASMLL